MWPSAHTHTFSRFRGESEPRSTLSLFGDKKVKGAQNVHSYILVVVMWQLARINTLTFYGVIEKS